MTAAVTGKQLLQSIQLLKLLYGIELNADGTGKIHLNKIDGSGGTRVWDGADATFFPKYDSRPEAEEKAFVTAFEVLELKLAPESTITTKDLEVADETIIKTKKNG